MGQPLVSIHHCESDVMGAQDSFTYSSAGTSNENVLLSKSQVSIRMVDISVPRAVEQRPFEPTYRL